MTGPHCGGPGAPSRDRRERDETRVNVQGRDRRGRLAAPSRGSRRLSCSGGGATRRPRRPSAGRRFQKAPLPREQQGPGRRPLTQATAHLHGGVTERPQSAKAPQQSILSRNKVQICPVSRYLSPFYCPKRSRSFKKRLRDAAAETALRRSWYAFAMPATSRCGGDARLGRMPPQRTHATGGRQAQAVAGTLAASCATRPGPTEADRQQDGEAARLAAECPATVNVRTQDRDSLYL